jgi:hypothetical protein
LNERLSAHEDAIPRMRAVKEQFDNTKRLENTVAAAGVVALPGENRAITTLTQLLADNAVYNLKDYLAAGDNLQDDTPNILAAATALQAAGRGILKAPKGTYKVVGSIGAALFTFTNLNGVVIDFSEALIADAAVYVGVQEAVLFKFVNCRNITIVGRVSSQVAVTTNPATTAPRGLVVAQLTQGCKNITVDLDITGCKMGLEPTRLFNDPDAYRSSQIRGRIVAAGCYYPYAAQFSGDNAELAIDTDTCGRSYYVYGVSNQRLNVRAKNQQVTSLIWAFSGFGCRDITVKFVDRDSTANQAAAPRMQLGWGDLTPATHANINLTVDVLNPAGSPFGSTFEFIKYSDGGTTPDAVGRGHVLDGFKLAGTSEQVAGVNHVTQGAGAFAAPDICRNVRVRDLTVVGANAAISFGPSSPISQLVGRAIFENVISTGHNVLAYNGANGEVLFVGCQALNFSGAVGEADVHTLLDCNATDGTNQSTVNKTFINTKVGALLRNDYLSPGRFELVASKQLTGDITGAAQSIFKLTPAIGNGVLFRLKYFLVKDQGDFNPASRQEVEGVKTFSATMDGAGAWTLQQVVAAEVAERTLGAGPAVLTVSLVNGDATGAAIAVTATNYNNANGKHTFILEAIPMTPNARLIAL